MAFISRTSKTNPSNMTYVDAITESNKWWYDTQYNDGGRSAADICLPNCTTYAKGRSCEIAGKLVRPLTISETGFPNARLWYQYANTDDTFGTGEYWVKSSTPKVGSILVCDTANTSNMGHVAIVESTDGTEDGTMVSYSGYVKGSGTRSFTNPGTSSSYYFIYESLTAMKQRYQNIGEGFVLSVIGYLENPFVVVTEKTSPVERNTSVDQINVIYEHLRVREDHSTASADLGYADLGFYNVIDTYEGTDYTWWKIADNNWVANVGESSVEFLPKQEIKYYTVTIVSDDPDLGSVSSGGIYASGTSIQLGSTPIDHYKLNEWYELDDLKLSDGSSLSYSSEDNLIAKTFISNVDTSFIVTKDAEIHASFKLDENYSFVTTESTNENITVSGAGEYHNDTVATIEATITGQTRFDKFKVGDTEITDNPYSFTVLKNTHIVAYGINYYVIETVSEGAGTVTAGGTYDEGTEITLNATPNIGGAFIKWICNDEDYSTDESINVVVDSNKTFKAVFRELDRYTITVCCNNSLYGVALGSGTYYESDVVTIQATERSSNFEFLGWAIKNDNQYVSTEKEYTFLVSGNTTYVAVFKQKNQPKTPLSLLQNNELTGVSFGERAVLNDTAKVAVDNLMLKTDSNIIASKDENIYSEISKSAYSIIDRGGDNSVSISNKDLDSGLYINNIRLVSSEELTALQQDENLEHHTLYLVYDNQSFYISK